MKFAPPPPRPKISAQTLRCFCFFCQALCLLVLSDTSDLSPFLVAKFRNHKNPSVIPTSVFTLMNKNRLRQPHMRFGDVFFFPFRPESEVTTQLTEENMRHSCFFQEFSRAGEIC